MAETKKRGPCAKTTVTCIIIASDGERFVGTNYCNNAQPTCPRARGEDYAKCADICQQAGHAEVVALRLAGSRAKGARAYLQGHSYACRDCQEALFSAGVESLSLGPPPMLSARPAAPSREAVARSIYTTACESYKAVPSWDREHVEVKDLHRAQADAILALFAAQPGEAKAVAVKQIVWRECFADRWQAQAAFGSAYDIVRASGNQYRVQYSWSGLLWNDERPTLEAAKASAQADYEARILSCLTTPPDTAALLEKAEKALEPFGRAAGVLVPGDSDDAHVLSVNAGDLRAAKALSDIRKARS